MEKRDRRSWRFLARFFLWILAFGAFVPFAEAQTPTLVTGTVKDANGIPYSNARISAQLVGIGPTVSATILVNSIPVGIGGQQNGSTDAGGNFTMNLFCNSAGGGCSVISPSGTQWLFTVNENGQPPPLGTGPQVCTATLTITGASQSVSSSFSSCPALSAGGGSGSLESIPVTRGLLWQYMMVPGSETVDTSGITGALTLGGACGGTSPGLVGVPGGGLIGNGASCFTIPAAANAAETIVFYASHTTSVDLVGLVPGQCLLAGNGNGGTAANDNALCLTGAAHPQINPLVGEVSFLTSGNLANTSSMDVFTGTGSVGIVMGQAASSVLKDVLYIDGVPVVDNALTQASVGIQTAGFYCGMGCSAGQGYALAGFYNNGNVYASIGFSVQLTAAEMLAVHNWLNAVMSARGLPTVNGGTTASGDVAIVAGDSISVESSVGASYWPAFVIPTGTQISSGAAGFAGQSQLQFLNLGAPAYTCQTDNLAAPFSAFPEERPSTSARQVSILACGANPDPSGISSTISSILSFGRQRRKEGIKSLLVTMLSQTGRDAVKNQLNTLERNLWPTAFDGLCDVAANPNLGADGASASGTYFSADAIHPLAVSMQNIWASIIQHCYNRLFGNTTQASANTYRVGATAVPWVLGPPALAQNVSGNPITVTFPATGAPNTTAGALMFCSLYWPGAQTLSTITDTQTNTYTKNPASATSNGAGSLAQSVFAPNIAGGADTITFTFSAGVSSMKIQCWQIMGVLTVAPLDVSGTNSGSGTNVATTSSITTTVVGDALLAFGAFAQSNGSITYTTPSPGFTFLAGSGPLNTFAVSGAATGYVTSVTESGTTAGFWAFDSAAFKPAVLASPVQLQDVDVFVNCDPGGGSIQLNLPDAIGMTNQTVTVKNIQSAGVNTCTIGVNPAITTGAQTIDGAATVTIANKATAVFKAVLVSPSAAGANWVQLQ